MIFKTHKVIFRITFADSAVYIFNGKVANL